MGAASSSLPAIPGVAREPVVAACFMSDWFDPRHMGRKAGGSHVLTEEPGVGGVLCVWSYTLCGVLLEPIHLAFLKAAQLNYQQCGQCRFLYFQNRRSHVRRSYYMRLALCFLMNMIPGQLIVFGTCNIEQLRPIICMLRIRLKGSHEVRHIISHTLFYARFSSVHHIFLDITNKISV